MATGSMISRPSRTLSLGYEFLEEYRRKRMAELKAQQDTRKFGNLQLPILFR